MRAKKGTRMAMATELLLVPSWGGGEFWLSDMFRPAADGANTLLSTGGFDWMTPKNSTCSSVQITFWKVISLLLQLILLMSALLIDECTSCTDYCCYNQMSIGMSFCRANNVQIVRRTVAKRSLLFKVWKTWVSNTYDLQHGFFSQLRKSCFWHITCNKPQYSLNSTRWTKNVVYTYIKCICSYSKAVAAFFFRCHASFGLLRIDDISSWCCIMNLHIWWV